MSITKVLAIFLRAPSGFVEVCVVPFKMMVGSVIRFLSFRDNSALMVEGLCGVSLILLHALSILVAVLLCVRSHCAWHFGQQVFTARVRVCCVLQTGQLSFLFLSLSPLGGGVVRAWSGHGDAVHFVQVLHVVACVGVGAESVLAVGQVQMVLDVCRILLLSSCVSLLSMSLWLVPHFPVMSSVFATVRS